jgi:O-succinylbenzoate synthase
VAPALETIAWSLPLHTRFRGLLRRDGLLVRVTRGEGKVGWGEFSPFADYDEAAAAPWWAAAREAAAGDWPAPLRDRIPVNVTVPAVGPDRARQLVAASDGCLTAKVKVAEPGLDAAASLAADVERVEAVRDALGPSGAIRVDANGGWDVDTAVRALTALDRAAATGGGAGLEYAEQPCAMVEELAILRRRTHVLIAADESIRRAEDPLRVARLGAADIAVLKVAPLGGVRECLRIAEEIGLPIVVSSALESSVGMAAGVALAAALPELPYACGLATVALFTADLARSSLLPVGGQLPVGAIEPDEKLLAAAVGAADPAATDRLRGLAERLS